MVLQVLLAVACASWTSNLSDEVQRCCLDEIGQMVDLSLYINEIQKT